jgi:hypothetical protein
MSAATQTMLALELLADHAYHDGNMRDLAVVEEAWHLAGYYRLDIAHAGHSAELEARYQAARRGRHRRLLRADARGMLAGVRALIDCGLLDERSTMMARNKRWLDRGGHDRA